MSKYLDKHFDDEFVISFKGPNSGKHSFERRCNATPINDNSGWIYYDYLTWTYEGDYKDGETEWIYNY